MSMADVRKRGQNDDDFGQTRMTGANDQTQTQRPLAEVASEAAEAVSTRLKSAGIDTDVMTDAARRQTTELQRMVAEELQARPLRALGIAAAVGAVLGIMITR
jgi:ElaB/YqjD/DUF883 family membrane-anchored ribosome-binding protein